MTRQTTVQCCIVGGGPAGMMLGYLLGRAGVDTVVMEKHGDFLRDFRGDTVHPSTLRILNELGLLPAFLRLPHAQLRALQVEVGTATFKVADFGRLSPPGNFIALMPQWDFLNFLLEQGRRFPSLRVLQSTEVTGLIEEDEGVVGVRARDANGALECRAHLVVGCDGRGSSVRAASGLRVEDLGSAIDVLWFRLTKQANDPQQILAHLGRDKALITIDRNDYWQCAYVIAKGGFEALRARGLADFRNAVVDGAKFLYDRVAELKSFDDIKLLSVSVDRLTTWSKPGLLCIGDAAHAMSPIGGVGINLAIQDAVAAANLLAAKLAHGTVSAEDLERVRRRRLWPVKVIQGLQVRIQNRVLKPRVTAGDGALSAPWPLRILDRSAWLRRWPAHLIGVGVRPEQVRSPDAHR